MKIKAVLFDLDGTLLLSDKTISKRTLYALKQCREKGILIGVSTSRSEQNSLVYLNEYAINNPVEKYVEEFSPYCKNLYIVFENITQMISSGDFSQAERISQESKALKKEFSNLRKLQTARLQDEESLKTAFVYLNLIQESHELLSEVRNALRGSQKFFAETLTPYFDEDEMV
mgnify:CR=1 FL=1